MQTKTTNHSTSGNNKSTAGSNSGTRSDEKKNHANQVARHLNRSSKGMDAFWRREYRTVSEKDEAAFMEQRLQISQMQRLAVGAQFEL